MSFSVYYHNNRHARTLRFIISILLIITFAPAINAACEYEKENAMYIAHQISTQWPQRPSYDSKTKYIQSLAKKLIHAAKLISKAHRFDWPSHSWHFSLLRDSSVNAYSIGNGNIYMTDGTLDFVKNEAELAAILAHEISHQLIGHFCKSDKTHDTYSIGSFLQVFNNNKEIAADTLAIEILQKAFFPARAMLTILKRSPSIHRNDAKHQKRLRVNSLKTHLKGLKNITFSSSPSFLQTQHY